LAQGQERNSCRAAGMNEQNRASEELANGCKSLIASG
jgi:hypothetical protein